MKDIKGYKTIAEVNNEAIKIIEDIAQGRLKPLLTSIDAERKKLRGFLPGDQIAIAGRSGSGKTSRVIAMMLDFLNVELNPHYAGKIVICFDSWEVSSYRTPLKFISNKMKMTMDKILDWEDTLSLEAINDMKSVLETFKDERIYIRDYSHSVKEWEDSKDDIAEKYPYPEYQVVNIVDHTRLVKNEFNEREADLLTNLMKASVDSKKKNNHINIFLSQLNRNIETNANSRADIGNTLPTASDLFGSDSVFQCSEFVIVLHRPGYYGLTEFKLTKSQVYNTGLTNPGLGDDDLLLECILKNRNGSTGLLMLKHDIKTNNFYNKPPENFQIRV